MTDEYKAGVRSAIETLTRAAHRDDSDSGTAAPAELHAAMTALESNLLVPWPSDHPGAEYEAEARVILAAYVAEVEEVGPDHSPEGGAAAVVSGRAADWEDRDIDDRARLTREWDEFAARWRA